METDDPAASTIPPHFLAPSSGPSTFTTGGVTLEAIMLQLQQMEVDFGGRLNYLIDEICQMNT